MQASASIGRSPDRRILFIALALGTLAAVLTIMYLRSAESRTRVVEQVPVPTRPVVVARMDIPAGEKITLNMIEARSIPDAGVAPNAATSVEQVIGQTVRYPVARGEQVSMARLISPVNSPALSFQIPPGMRAFTFPVNANRSPVTLLVPGDFVDVLAILTGEDLGIPLPFRVTGDPRDVDGVATVLQNVQVLAVESQYVANGVPYDDTVRGAPGKISGNDVTLAVTPEEAQFLTLVVQRAKFLTVALRPFADNATHELRPTTGPIQFTADRPTLP